MQVHYLHVAWKAILVTLRLNPLIKQETQIFTVSRCSHFYGSVVLPSSDRQHSRNAGTIHQMQLINQIWHKTFGKRFPFLCDTTSKIKAHIHTDVKIGLDAIKRAERGHHTNCKTKHFTLTVRSTCLHVAAYYLQFSVSFKFCTKSVCVCACVHVSV